MRLLTEPSLFVLGSVFSQAMKKWVQGSSDQVSLQDVKVFPSGSAECFLCIFKLASCHKAFTGFIESSETAERLCSDVGARGNGLANRQDDRQ